MRLGGSTTLNIAHIFSFPNILFIETLRTHKANRKKLCLDLSYYYIYIFFFLQIQNLFRVDDELNSFVVGQPISPL